MALAALLFLVSVGLSLVFGILRVVNFAHGIFYMLGAYLCFTAVTLSGSFWLSLLVAPLVVGIFGALLESSTLRFIYRRPPIYQLLLTFGLALMLEEGVRLAYGPTAKPVDPPLAAPGNGHARRIRLPALPALPRRPRPRRRARPVALPRGARAPDS